MQYKSFVFILVLRLILNGQTLPFCSKLPKHLLYNASGNDNSSTSVQERCFTLGRCRLTIITSNNHHFVQFKHDDIDKKIFSHFSPSSLFQLKIDHHLRNRSLMISSFGNEHLIENGTEISTKLCHKPNDFGKRALSKVSTSRTSSSVILTFNSSSFIDFYHSSQLEYPLSLSVRFRTLGRILSGVLLSLTHRSSPSNIIPYIIIEHSNGKIEITVLQLDERKVLAPVTTIQAGKNINNDQWHWLQFEIDVNGVFTLIVDDDSRTSQIPSYVVAGWNINGLLVGDTRRLSSDIFQPFIGYISDLVFNDEHLFARFQTDKQSLTSSSFEHDVQNLIVGYRISFFNLLTIDTATSYVAFSERESQNKNHGKLDIYFLFRSYVPDGIILYRYAQGLNEYFAIGLRAGILAVFIDFGFGKRQIVSDESTKLADGKWHEVRVTRIGTDKIELIVDNRVNRSTLSTNGIRNAVSLQPVLYIGGIPNSNSINLTGSGLNAQGFQGCLASFIVDGRLLDYQRALVLNGKLKMNVCSDSSNILPSNDNDLNKLCYDFTCIHSGVCSTDEDRGPTCDCIETGYTGERCDKFPPGFYFGKHHTAGSIEFSLVQTGQYEQDSIVFGLQTVAMSAQIFHLDFDAHLFSLEYEIVRGRSYLKYFLGEKQPEVYSAVTHITDGFYHVIKIIRRFSSLEFYADGIRIKLEGGPKLSKQIEKRPFSPPKRVLIGNFRNTSHWNGIIAGFSINRQSIFDSFSDSLLISGDVNHVSPDPQTGLFQLVEAVYTATAFIAQTTSTLPTTTATTTTLNTDTNFTPVADYLYHSDIVTKFDETPMVIDTEEKFSYKWFYKYLRRLGTRGLILISLLSLVFLVVLLMIIIYLHDKNRRTIKNISYPFVETNGKMTRYSQVQSSNEKKNKRFPKIFSYFQKKKPKIKGTISRLNSGDSYHLISSIQENLPDKLRTNFKVNDSTCSQATSSSPGSVYHQVNRLILSGNESRSLRVIRKEMDNSTAQTYSAVYSCDLADNLDLHGPTLTARRRSISKIKKNPLNYLFMKNLVDCYSIESYRSKTFLLATADGNQIQLTHGRSGAFHSQLSISSNGACHDLFFSYLDRFLIGLFHEITPNINPYAVKIWSTEDHSIRANLHPIKCSIAVPSEHSSILFMAGKQKYGRGISLGLLDLENSTLARELKSDPETSIGDEIKRIILTKNETHALVVCTEHSSSLTCFIVFQLENSPFDQSLNLSPTGAMNNCTMILTRFDCQPNFTFAIHDSNNDVDRYVLTILRTNQILIWQLNDGEILIQHSLDESIGSIVDCQMIENRLLILNEFGSIEIWDISMPSASLSLISTVNDPSISYSSWLDYEHFLTMDADGQRLRLWKFNVKEALHQALSLSTRIQTLRVHPVGRKTTDHQQEYAIVGLSMNERSLVMFQFNPNIELYDR